MPLCSSSLDVASFRIRLRAENEIKLESIKERSDSIQWSLNQLVSENWIIKKFTLGGRLQADCWCPTGGKKPENDHQKGIKSSPRHRKKTLEKQQKLTNNFISIRTKLEMRERLVRRCQQQQRFPFPCHSFSFFIIWSCALSQTDNFYYFIIALHSSHVYMEKSFFASSSSVW